MLRFLRVVDLLSRQGQDILGHCFDLNQASWSFAAEPSVYLQYGTTLPVPKTSRASANAGKSTHDGAYWAAKTAGFDFSKEDNLKDPDKFNRIIWEGLKGNIPYPVVRNGADLRSNRAELLEGTVSR